MMDKQINAFNVFNGNIYAGSQYNGIFRSTNDGISWESAGLTNKSVYDLVQVNNSIIAGTNSGIFTVLNENTNWTSASEGLPGVPIVSVYIMENMAFAGIEEAGVWRRPFSEIMTDLGKTENAISLDFRLEQNYPNPFNPATTISFTIPSNDFVTLKVFDLTGREIAILVSEEKSRGEYKMQWKPEELASGIYFYRLQAGKFSETKKLILLK